MTTIKAQITVRGRCKHHRAECVFKRNRVLYQLAIVAETPALARQMVEEAAREIEPLLVFI